jgi:excisionase family DNA binding protein
MREKRCYTVKELQAILGVSRPSVYELLKKDVFRSFIVGGKHIISKSSFDEWLDGDFQTEESQKVMDF